jgi:hypothetical protein
MNFLQGKAQVPWGNICFEFIWNRNHLMLLMTSKRKITYFHKVFFTIQIIKPIHGYVGICYIFNCVKIIEGVTCTKTMKMKDEKTNLSLNLNTKHRN